MVNVFDFCQVRKVYFVTSEQLNEDDPCVWDSREAQEDFSSYVHPTEKNSIVSERRLPGQRARFPGNFENLTDDRLLLKGKIPTMVVCIQVSTSLYIRLFLPRFLYLTLLVKNTFI